MERAQTQFQDYLEGNKNPTGEEKIRKKADLEELRGDKYKDNRYRIWPNKRYQNKFVKENGDSVWPANDGAKRDSLHRVELRRGQEFDRIGYENGGFLGHTGDPMSARSMEPGSLHNALDNGLYNKYLATGRPLPEGWRAESAVIEGHFTQPGGGVQTVILNENGKRVPVLLLEKLHILRKVG